MPSTKTNLSTSTTKKVIVFGSTGAIGRLLIDLISKEAPNWTVDAVTRDASTDKFAKYPNVTVVEGDANNQEAVMKMSKDKDLVFSCIGFPQYEAKFWAKQWPIVVDNLLAATKQKEGQRLIFCDNLYAYGPTTNISPSTPTVKPGTKSKPAIRALLRQKFQDRMTESPNSIVVVGGADFFGQYVTKMSFMGDTFTKAIVNEKPAPICVGSSSVTHDFAYAPDFAKALYLVALHGEKANGKFWVCPHTIHGKSLSDIAKDISKLCGPKNKNSKVTCYPGWSVRLVGLFDKFMSEMVEMLPFWSNDYSVDDSDFVETFGVAATPYEEALQQYIDFYKSLES